MKNQHVYHFDNNDKLTKKQENTYPSIAYHTHLVTKKQVRWTDDNFVKIFFASHTDFSWLYGVFNDNFQSFTTKIYAVALIRIPRVRQCF